jgi:predicted Zn finger-like uncharacterized protein
MMIECPACATRYEVPDNAIGPSGRNVRCAKCDHRWQEYGNNAPPASQDEAAVPDWDDRAVEPLSDDAEAVASPADPVASDPVESTQQPEPRVSDETVSMHPRTTAGRQTEPLDQPPPARRSRRRGSPVRLLVWAAIIILLVVGAAFASVRLLGMPDWVPGDGSSFASGEPGLKLNFPDDQLGMRQLPDGTEIFGARGTITNVGETERSVPPILIVLRDGHDRIVYSWEVMPAKRSLAPGESIAVNEAVTDVPRSARVADIGWKPG